MSSVIPIFRPYGTDGFLLFLSTNIPSLRDGWAGQAVKDLVELQFVILSHFLSSCIALQSGEKEGTGPLISTVSSETQ